MRHICINRKHLKRNKNGDVRYPVINIEDESNKNEALYEVSIEGPCRLVYRPDTPLFCGAHLFIDLGDSQISIDPQE